MTKLPFPSVPSYWLECRYNVGGEAAIMDSEVRGECWGWQKTKTGGIWVPTQTNVKRDTLLQTIVFLDLFGSTA